MNACIRLSGAWTENRKNEWSGCGVGFICTWTEQILGSDWANEFLEYLIRGCVGCRKVRIYFEIERMRWPLVFTHIDSGRIFFGISSMRLNFSIFFYIFCPPSSFHGLSDRSWLTELRIHKFWIDNGRKHVPIPSSTKRSAIERLCHRRRIENCIDCDLKLSETPQRPFNIFAPGVDSSAPRNLSLVRSRRTKKWMNLLLHWSNSILSPFDPTNRLACSGMHWTWNWYANNVCRTRLFNEIGMTNAPHRYALFENTHRHYHHHLRQQQAIRNNSSAARIDDCGRKWRALLHTAHTERKK